MHFHAKSTFKRNCYHNTKWALCELCSSTMQNLKLNFLKNFTLVFSLPNEMNKMIYGLTHYLNLGNIKRTKMKYYLLLIELLFLSLTLLFFKGRILLDILLMLLHMPSKWFLCKKTLQAKTSPSLKLIGLSGNLNNIKKHNKK